jgi:hypothetical protein
MATFPDPAYPDSFYYVDVARQIAAGHGLNVDFVWIFAEVGGKIPANPVLPIPSNAHWLPLASFIQVPFIAALGPTAVASALPMVILGAFTAPLTWAIARDAGASRTVQAGAGVLAAIPAAGTVFMAQPENFALVGVLWPATLWLAARGLRGDGPAYVGAGLLVGLASITRNDAILLGAAVGLVFVVERVRAWRRGARPSISLSAAVGCVALYLLVVGPWWIRQLQTFGSISPTASSGSALWLTSIRQWNSITADTSLTAFLATGLQSIVTSRLAGLVAAIGIFAVIIGSIILVPFMVWGGWHRRRSDAFLPWFLYAAVLFAGATFLFPVHVPGGTFIHSAIGLAPQAYILALEGVALLVAAIARRRPNWETGPATRLFSWTVVGLAVLSGILFIPVVQASWRDVANNRGALANQLDRLGVPATDRVMSIDAAGMKYATGRPGVVSPDDPIDTIEKVAEAYDIRWLVLEDGGVEALKPVSNPDDRPAWIGPAAFTVPATTAGEPPALALYPVCTTAGDDRCGSAVAEGRR